MCGTIFNRHDWEELGSKRVCRKCGEKQILVPGFDREWWETPNRYNMGLACYECNGWGASFDNNFRKQTCPHCNGTGIKGD